VTNKSVRLSNLGRYSALVSILILAGTCMPGCAAQHSLTAGAKYAEAYSKIGALVNESFSMAEEARIRSEFAEKARLVRPTSEDEAIALRLACKPLDESTAQALFATGNLARYQEAIGSLAKSTDKTMAAVVSGLKKSLPTSEKIVKSFADFQSAEVLRVENCLKFGHDSLAQTQPFATGATGAEVSAVLNIIKAFLAAYETERRADAYKKLVIQLEKPVRENLLTLHAEVEKLLNKSAAEGLRSLARETGMTDTSDPPKFYGSVDSAAGAANRFKRSFSIYQVIYLPHAGEKTAFTALIEAHAAIAEAAKGGDVDGAAAIDDILALLAFVKDIEEKLAEL
jgi:hypothetical protein